jgi:hypothetical protein
MNYKSRKKLLELKELRAHLFQPTDFVKITELRKHKFSKIKNSFKPSQLLNGRARH